MGPLLIAIAAVAGTVPIWAASVETNYSVDDNFNLVTTVTVNQIEPPVYFTLTEFSARTSPLATYYDALLDYGQPRAETLYATLAEWNYDITQAYPLLVDVFSYTASAEPPTSLDARPTGAYLTTLAINPIDTGEVALTLPASPTGAYLLEVEQDPDLGLPTVNLQTTGPEPATWLLWLVGLIAMGIYYGRKR